MHIALEVEQGPAAAESASLALAHLLNEHEQQLAAIEREKNAEIVALSAELARLEAESANEDLARGVKGKAREEKRWDKAVAREEKRLFKQERKCDKEIAKVEKESAKEFAKQEEERFKAMADREKERTKAMKDLEKEHAKEIKEREKEIAKTMKEKEKEIARLQKEKEKALAEFSKGMKTLSRSETRGLKREGRQEKKELKWENEKATRAERCATSSRGGSFGHEVGSGSDAVFPGWEDNYERDLRWEKVAVNGQSAVSEQALTADGHHPGGAGIEGDEPEPLHEFDAPPLKHDAPPPYTP
jgi:hypothetical protein